MLSPGAPGPRDHDTPARARGSWPTRLIAEGVVVVASILTAFALDAWWDRRSAAASLSEALDGIRIELENNRALLVREMGSLDRITGAGNAVLDRMQANEARASIAIADTLAFLISGWAPSLEVSLGAVDALIASGRLAEVGDARLRLGLAGLRDRFADVVEDELVGRRIHVDQQGPLLSRLTHLRELAPLDAAFFSGVDVAKTPVLHLGDIAYPNSLELRNIIYRKVGWYGSARGEITTLIEHIDGLIELTRQQLR